jgi:hypothetical protein
MHTKLLALALAIGIASRIGFNGRTTVADLADQQQV